MTLEPREVLQAEQEHLGLRWIPHHEGVTVFGLLGASVVGSDHSVGAPQPVGRQVGRP